MPIECEPAQALNHGGVTAIVREYVDDREGRSRLETDAAALRAQGYELASRERRPRTPGWKRSVSMLIGLLSFSTVHFYPAPGPPKIVATFELHMPRPSQAATAAAILDHEPASALLRAGSIRVHGRPGSGRRPGSG
jgi:hypothetical protein